MEHILDITGLTYFWGKIKDLFATGTAGRTAAIPFGKVDSTSTATTFTATVDGITELTEGTCVYLMNGVVTSAAATSTPKCFTLNINGLGAKPVYYTTAAATYATTQFGVNYTMLFVYNTTRVSTGCWDIFYGYDSNTNTIGYQLRTNSATLPAKFKTYRYRLLFTSPEGTHFVAANASTSTDANAAKTPTTEKIDPFGAIVYYGYTTAINANANFGATYLWSQYVLNLGYSFNGTGAALTLTYPKPVYVKCAPQTDGSAIIDATTPYVQTLPSTEDGKIYIFLGIAYSATNIELMTEHPVYYYKDGAIRQWMNAALPDLSGYQETIDDLDDIRAGAALGATALQSYTESDPTVPAWAKASAKPSYTPQEIGALPDSYTPPVLSVNGQTGEVTLTIPPTITESTISGWGFTKNTGTYSKPNGGIPKTDLESDVQTSLGLANTALQSFTESDPTVPSHVKGITSTDISNWNAKQSAISDLETIRNGAALGATALQSYTETDPTVPSWAKSANKPSYTAVEVGAVPTTRKVNGKALSADVTLSASDVDALPSSTTIPTKVSDLTNDSGFTTNTGTITGITMNGVSKGTSGVVDLGTVITEHQSLADYYTKSQVNNLLVPANTTIVVVSTLPASGSANTIYRVAGTNSYTDYGWDGTQFVALATYNTAYDAGGALS